MNTRRGYKLKLESLKDLSSFMEDFRGAATKVLARKWTADVADRAAEACDFAGLGLTTPTGDVIRTACNELNLKLANSDLSKHAYNCAIDFYFVESAVLAIFNHGDKDYQEVWRKKRVVEHWGWARDVERPGTISEKQWQLRERVWTALSKRPRFGLTLNFQLLSTPLPVVTPKQVIPLLPTYETRIENAVAALLAQEGKKLKSVSEHEIGKLREHVTRRIVSELTPDHLLGVVPVALPPQASAQKLKNPIAELRPVPKLQSKKADSIDHADIVLSSDGRTFIAVPNVGLADNSRVFVHVGTKDVVFIQDGINFGTVTEVPEAAREHLKFCKEAVLVEVEKTGEDRLLRARYVAIVTDISFTEHQRQSMIVGFKRPTRSSAASREFEEWEKNTQHQ
jgi:hypothetical protein